MLSWFDVKSHVFQILLSVVRRSKLYPSNARWNEDVFVMVNI